MALQAKQRPQTPHQMALQVMELPQELQLELLDQPQIQKIQPAHHSLQEAQLKHHQPQQAIPPARHRHQKLQLKHRHHQTGLYQQVRQKEALHRVGVIHTWSWMERIARRLRRRTASQRFSYCKPMALRMDAIPYTRATPSPFPNNVVLTKSRLAILATL